MSLFRKPKKQIQRRVFTEDSDNEDEPMDTSETPKNVRQSKKKDKLTKTPKTKTQTLLSFETEEEGEVFQVKKSSHNKKVMRMFEKDRKKKDSAPKTEKETPRTKDKTEIITDDLILVVTHKKPPTPPPPPILSGRDALCAGKNDLSSESEDDSSETAHRFNKPDNFKKVLESGAIPDAAMIHAARKSRQRAREMGDYIPVEDERAEPEDTGRLLREDEHEGSDEDRIDMDLNHAKRDQERRREQFLAAQESDQENEWEDQQIRKGVTSAPSVVAAELMSYQYEMPQAQLHEPPKAPIIAPDVPRTPQMIAESLKQQYQSICQSRELNVVKLQKVQEDIVELSRELDELKIKAPKAAERFRFYQELRGYVTDLVECLDEKVGVIHGLEIKAMDLMSKKATWLIERRRQDVRDQADEVTSKGTNIKRGPEDEWKQRRAAEREGRRTRRRRARELADQGTKHTEGMSSDDEISQQDTHNFDKEQQEIELEVTKVFEDVTEDFSNISNMLIRFEQWREFDITVYNEAYATLCLPKIVSPLTRLNLIFWDPLTQNGDIDKLPWYRTLALYGLHDNETENILASDPDINLIPTLVEKILVPKITLLVDKCWDPISNSQTLRLLSVITRFIRRYPTLGPASKPLSNLFNAILHKMKTALEHDVFIPIIPKLAENKSPFFQRQFASGLKLLKSITSWQGVLNESTLKELALTSLLNRYLLSAVKLCPLLDAASKINLISQVLPRCWLQASTLELKMFTSCVMNLLNQLDGNNPLHLESIDTLNSVIKLLRS